LSNVTNSGPRGPVFIYEPTHSQVAFANTKGTLLDCSAFGRPAPVLEWAKEDGSFVDNIPGVIEILHNNSLYFPPFQDGAFRADVHIASYRCMASNLVGTIISRKVKIKAVLIEQYKSYNVRVNDVWAMRGTTAVFRCEINPYIVKDYVNITGWWKSNTVIKPDDRYSILPSGELHIRNFRDEDTQSTYRCITNNVLTGDQKASLPASLNVIAATINSPPHIQDTVSQIKLQEGHTVELPCTATGYPLPRYSWTKDGTAVVTDQSKVFQRGGNLVIRNVVTSDSGTYICTASNTLGSKTAATQLTISAPLSVSVTPTRQTIDGGDPASLNCSIHGYPVSSVTWFKDGRLLTADDHVSFENDRVLRLASVQRMDKGMYQCVASNEEDNAQGSAQLDLGAAKPLFHGVFQEQYMQQHTSISLKCIASGNPIPNVTWTLDAGEIPKNGRFRMGYYVTPQGDVISHVNITDLRVEDGGLYRCFAENKVGSLAHQNRLNIYGVPYIRPMKNVSAVANDKLVIPCYASGFPLQSIEWSKGGHTLPINHRQAVSTAGVLTVENVQKSYDEGAYVCTASNNKGQIASRSVHVQVMEPPRIDRFNFPKRKEGDRVSVSCMVSSGDTPITLSWLKDGQAIPLDLGITVQRLGPYMSTLMIGDVTPQHNGNYTCIAQNSAAMVNYTAELHVDVPPRWVVEPSNSFVVLSQTVLLHCQSTGTPEPTVMWKKAKGENPGNYQVMDFSETAPNGRPHRHLFPNGTLVINQAREEDHGYYLCHASNGIGTGLSKVVFLNVHIPARFDENKRNHSVLKGASINISCDAIGDMPMSLGWSFNGEQLNWQNNQRLALILHNTDRGRTTKLTINPAVREDSGFYVCIAKNAFGDDTLLIELTVLEKPEAPVDVEVGSKWSRSASISWRAPFNGNSLLLNYVIQYKNFTDVWSPSTKNLTTLPNVTMATLHGLHPAYNYSVRMLAVNKLGEGLPSDVVNFTTREEAPSGPPTDIQLKATGSQSLEVTWQPPLPEHQNGVIQGYYVGYKIYNSSTPYIYITRQNSQGFTRHYSITNLEKFTKYALHIQAFNSEGAGPKSPDSVVMTLEDVPSRPPQSVQATPLSSVSIRVLWAPPPFYTLNGVLLGFKVLYKPVTPDEDESDAQVITTKNINADIHGLEKFTNYSLQVLAYTRMGEGVRSAPIYVRTEQDEPGQPADVKALAMNESSILITWKKPLRPNGIIQKYIIYFKHNDAMGKEILDRVEVPPSQLSYSVTGLVQNRMYTFQVSAATIVGEGERTREVSQTPVERVAARVASFSARVLTPWKENVMLPCLTVGDPVPSIQWRKRGVSLTPDNSHVKILENGTLEIVDVQGVDAANYTCQAVNQYGADEITISLIVQVNRDIRTPPRAPTISVAVTTEKSVQVNWRSGSNGGSTITGFILMYKADHEDWTEVTTRPQNRTYTAQNLKCGTQYRFKMKARNSIGLGDLSNIITTKTNGSAPIMPPQSMLLEHINSTFITLNLNSWQTDKCPITSFTVKYQVWGDSNWATIPVTRTDLEESHLVEDLHPATWYIMKVIANSDAGSTESVLKFATLTYTGEKLPDSLPMDFSLSSTITPIMITHKYEPEFYQKIHVMVPLSLALVLVITISLGTALYCKRRHEAMRWKEAKSNLRRDITAETSLMTDLDKRFDKDSDSSNSLGYTPEPVHLRNVNLLIMDQSNEELPGPNTDWTNQENAQNTQQEMAGSVDSDGFINPYATFCYPKPGGPTPPLQPIRTPLLQTFTKHKHTPQHGSQDLVALEKTEAQRKFAEKFPFALPPPPPPISTATNVLPEVNLLSHPKYRQATGVGLSPRKFASADAIHALFTGRNGKPGPPPHHHQTYSIPSNSRPPSQMSSICEKAGQRNSAISSVTTVSSNHDELMLAFHNGFPSTVTPPDSENQKEDSIGTPQPTDNSSDTTVTEPGIRQFTQSPPRPDERRQAACEVPLYEQNRVRRPSQLDLSSDTTDYDPLPRRKKSPHRRRRSRGHVLSKKVMRQPRGAPVPIRPSSTSTTNSEEITYAFDDRGHHRPSSPSEGYLSYPYTESESNPYYVRRRSRRYTPVAKYEVTPDTPGTDENRPLMMSLAKPALASPQEEEEVGLIDRIYRTVSNSDLSGSLLVDVPESQDKHYIQGYTEDFTVV
ncbi:Down syndrome cell adhesion molecule homolog, partial [Lingula anatina]|uniref:Down syndrome cell adhesion molecule homolog n=1 Tax=Lingula anatina TaxID=7574 RepID=A0A1S3JUD3_LINAN